MEITMTMDTQEFRKAMELNFKAGVTCEGRGASGIGKSDIALQYAEDQGDDYGLLELNAATANLPDLMGLLMPGEETHISPTGEAITIQTGRYSYPYFMYDKRTGRPGFMFRRALLLIEEYGQANPDLKRGLANFIWSGTAGGHPMPGKIDVLLLSNRPDDRSGVTKDFDFLINRRNIIDVRATLEPWLVWAHDHGVSNVSLAYAARNEENVFANKAPKEQGPWLTPRSLVTADKVLTEAIAAGYDMDDPFVRKNLNGAIGEGNTHRYIGFAKIRHELPTLKQIVDNPTGCKLPTETDQQMFLVFDLASKANKMNIAPIIQYVNRMPSDFSITFYRSAMQRDKELRSTRAFSEWAVNNVQLLSALAQAR
jgi:hypothetical protein